MRIAIISDIHEDIRNLQKIFAKIEKTAYDQLICLGDISGYSIAHYNYRIERNAHACLSELRERSCIILPGNHDFQAAEMIPKHSAIFNFPANWYDLDSEQQTVLGKGEIWLKEEDELVPNYKENDIEYLRSLPEYYVQKGSEYDILFSHYIYPNLSGLKKGFYTRGNEFGQHFKWMEDLGCVISFSGHAHVRGYYSVSNGHFNHHQYRRSHLNKLPVCIGIPPVTRNKKRSGFCIFDVDKSDLRVIRC